MTTLFQSDLRDGCVTFIPKDSYTVYILGGIAGSTRLSNVTTYDFIEHTFKDLTHIPNSLEDVINHGCTGYRNLRDEPVIVMVGGMYSNSWVTI